MNTFLRYLGYVTLSLLFGWLSAKGKYDVLKHLGDNLFPILITVLVLYITLSNLVFNQLYFLKEKFKINIDTGIKALKRSLIWLFIVLSGSFVLIILVDMMPENNLEWIPELLNKTTLKNSIVFFSLFYYLLVIYDSTMAFYNLMQANSKDES